MSIENSFIYLWILLQGSFIFLFHLAEINVNHKKVKPLLSQINKKSWLHLVFWTCVHSWLYIFSGQCFCFLLSCSPCPSHPALFVDVITRRSAPRVEGNRCDMQVALKSFHCSLHRWPYMSAVSALISVKTAILRCVDVYPSQRNSRE